jgi:hypothetical protein
MTRFMTRVACTLFAVAGSSRGRRTRARGTIDELESGALRGRVYAGIDPLTQKRHDLVEAVPRA